MTSQDQEAHVMKKTIGVIDKEKDFLQEAVDEKTEKIANLQENLANKVCHCYIWLSSIWTEKMISFSVSNMQLLPVYKLTPRLYLVIYLNFILPR